MITRLLTEHRAVFEIVLSKIRRNAPAPGILRCFRWHRKTLLLKLLLAELRKYENFASSGIVVTLLSEERTAHSVLKLPLNLARQETPIRNISKKSNRALILWLLMSAPCYIYAERRNNWSKTDGLFDGVITFRQTLSVITKGTPADELISFLKSSYLLDCVLKMNLNANKRVQLHNDMSAGKFPVLGMRL